MSQIKVSPARRHFKQRIGQINHFLITILVGLDGVKKGTCELPEEFRTTWNPQNVDRSAERSTRFALDATLSWAIDNLDSYFIETVRKPSIIEDPNFEAKYNGAERSVNKRFEVFLEKAATKDGDVYKYAALVALSIQWRNNLVHFAAKNKLDPEYDSFLRENKDLYAGDEFRHLDIEKALQSFGPDDEHPSFKEVTSMIHAIHKFVEHVDRALLSELDVERYKKDLLEKHFLENKKAQMKVNNYSEKRREVFFQTLFRQYGGVMEDSE